MPRVGMRIVKSAAAVFLCFMIDLLRDQGIPFYSAIATLLCMQNDVAGSVKVAMNRVTGTLLGGVAGMGALLLDRAFIPRGMPVVQYLLVSLMIIPIIYLTVITKNSAASYITCVVFMSVAVSHGADVEPWLFALNRVVDTLIGIGVSIGINSLHLLRYRKTGILTALKPDLLIDRKSGEIPMRTKVKLNQMLDCGALLTVISADTPAGLLHLLEGVRLRLPVVVMGGAALYHLDSKTYEDCRSMPRETVFEIERVFAAQGRGCFVHTVIHDILHVYYDDLVSLAEKTRYDSLRTSPHQHYICARLPENRDALFVSAFDRQSAAERLYDALLRLPAADALRISLLPYPTCEGFCEVTVSHKDASMKTALETLRVRIGAKEAKEAGEARDAGK